MDLASVLISGGALLVAILAATFSGISLCYGRGQRDAAIRQATAAEAQTVYMGRQLEVMESELEFTHEVPASSAPAFIELATSGSARTRVPPWSLAHYRGDTFTLTNGSDETVYAVQIEMPEHTIHRGPYRWESIDPHAGETFLLAFSMASSSRKVTITWRWAPDGDVQSWSSTVPPKR
ncbi:hypothetical protein SAMN04489860_0404 [Paraoerskovia marina]|uniref:Uncharacterized protein n=1 Tax=Paraoerskovia marina TaxID=545619 RepID=A0A1H1N1K5_9CELL|nr:hypothetical protein [Paraoerskovia marina]SDR92770.1 hypothetical protein SAMN04489860_0404 [Paraoerskovia marina]